MLKAEKYYPYEKIIVDLKEKLINQNEESTLGGVDQKKQAFKLHSMASPEENSGKKLVEWEKFLNGALADDYTNEDLHLKLVKSFLKSSNISKLFRHILSLELSHLFSSSPNWYVQVTAQLETSFAKLKTSSNPNQTENLEYLNVALIILLNHHLLASIEINTGKTGILVELLLKLDKYLRDYELSLRGQSLPYQTLILNEFKAQLLYIFALLLMRIDSRVDTFEHDIFKLCMLKSLLVSKPNNIFFMQFLGKKTSISKKEILNAVEVVHNDSAMRFSVIGNWLKFLLSNGEHADYFKVIKLVDSNGILQYLSETFPRAFHQQALTKENSFLTSVNETLFFHLSEEEKLQALNVTDVAFGSALDIADKYALANQANNLKFLVWHTLINTNFRPLESTGLKEILPYCKFFCYSTF